MIYFQTAVVLIQAFLAAAIIGCLIAALRAVDLRAPWRKAAGNALLGICCVVFLGSGVSKLLHVPLVVEEMTLLGLTGIKYAAVATLEILSGFIVMLPRLRSLALPWVSAHVGGAICAHMIAGQYFAILPSSVILSLFWLGMILSHPQILWSLSLGFRDTERAEKAASP